LNFGFEGLVWGLWKLLALSWIEGIGVIVDDGWWWGRESGGWEFGEGDGGVIWEGEWAGGDEGGDVGVILGGHVGGEMFVGEAVREGGCGGVGGVFAEEGGWVGGGWDGGGRGGFLGAGEGFSV
jgi:hypothetical protein